MFRTVCFFICIALMSFVLPDKDVATIEGDNLNISIYPNPLTEDVMFLEAEHFGLISIFTSAGERVFSQNYNQGVNEYDISKIEPGEYIFKVVSDGSMSIASFEMTRK